MFSGEGTVPLPRSLFQWGGDTPFPDPTPYSILAPTALDLATPRLQMLDPPLISANVPICMQTTILLVLGGEQLSIMRAIMIQNNIILLTFLLNRRDHTNSQRSTSASNDGSGENDATAD